MIDCERIAELCYLLLLFASRSIAIISHFELNVATATHADPAPLARMVDDLDGLSPEDAAAHLTNFVHEANQYLDIYISGFLVGPEFDAVVRAISECKAKVIDFAETTLGPRMNAMLNLLEASGVHVIVGLRVFSRNGLVA